MRGKTTNYTVLANYLQCIKTKTQYTKYDKHGGPVVQNVLHVQKAVGLSPARVSVLCHWARRLTPT